MFHPIYSVCSDQCNHAGLDACDGSRPRFVVTFASKDVARDLTYCFVPSIAVLPCRCCKEGSFLRTSGGSEAGRVVVHLMDFAQLEVENGFRHLSV